MFSTGSISPSLYISAKVIFTGSWEPHTSLAFGTLQWLSPAPHPPLLPIFIPFPDALHLSPILLSSLPPLSSFFVLPSPPSLLLSLSPPSSHHSSRHVLLSPICPSICLLKQALLRCTDEECQASQDGTIRVAACRQHLGPGDGEEVAYSICMSFCFASPVSRAVFSSGLTGRDTASALTVSSSLQLMRGLSLLAVTGRSLPCFLDIVRNLLGLLRTGLQFLWKPECPRGP